jgi:hypothetical protein
MYSYALHLHLRHRHLDTIPNVVFVQTDVVIQGAGAQGNDGTSTDGKGGFLERWRDHIRCGRAHFRGAGPSPPSPQSLQALVNLVRHNVSQHGRTLGPIKCAHTLITRKLGLHHGHDI